MNRLLPAEQADELVRSTPSRTTSRLLKAGTAVVCLAALVAYAAAVDPLYPVRDWLAWRVLSLWAAVLLLHAGCWSLGTRVVVDLLRVRDRPPLETAVLGAGVGAVAWVLALYVLGVVGFYRPAPMVTLCVAFLVTGGRAARGELTRIREAAARVLPLSPVPIAAVVFGVIGASLIYLEVLSPDAINYDTTWYHFPVAQDYAREGRIVAFPADYAKNLPHLTSFLHLFGFVLFRGNAPLNWMFALHNEFALFCWTLAGVAAATNWILGEGHRVRGAWAALFLFPGFFAYDSNLGGQADHVMAFLALPLLLAAVRLAREPTQRNAVLWAALAGGVLMTKYQAVYLLLPTALVIALGWAWTIRRRRHAAPDSDERMHAWRSVLEAAAMAAGVFVAVAAPHFLRNAIFYKNPVYPFMQQVFTRSTPRFATDGAYLFAHVFTDVNWEPKGTLLERLLNAVQQFGLFSFKPHYYFEIHHNFPAFGPLFTLTLPILLFLGRQPRLWLTAACASAAVFLWAMTFLVDRNLQTFLPWLVVATAATLVLAWRQGGIARLGVGLLVAFQVVWGADTMFYSFAGADRLLGGVNLIRSGITGNAKTRFDAFRADPRRLGASLPETATVLLHDSHMHLGIDRRVLLDWPGFQGLLDYRQLHTPRELHDALSAMGVTHVVREVSQRGSPVKQEDVLLALYLSDHAQSVGVFGGLEALAIAATPPPEGPEPRVLAFGVSGYPDGLYPLSQLNVEEGLLDVHAPFPTPEKPWPADGNGQALLAEAQVVVLGQRNAPPDLVRAQLDQRYRSLRVAPTSLQIFVPR
jgi:hypothetical protein